MQPKSERLRKLENELADLEQWLNLGLVPKKDLEKHKEEISQLKLRIEDEHKRLQSIKENGDLDEYILPRRGEKKVGYEGADLEMEEEGGGGLTDLGMDMEESFQSTSSDSTEVQEDRTNIEEDEEDPFSDKNRWKRGMLDEQDTSQW